MLFSLLAGFGRNHDFAVCVILAESGSDSVGEVTCGRQMSFLSEMMCW